jgi:tRNA A37 N6-isopentenylltransferase MiaA
LSAALESDGVWAGGAEGVWLNARPEKMIARQDAAKNEQAGRFMNCRFSFAYLFTVPERDEGPFPPLLYNAFTRKLNRMEVHPVIVVLGPTGSGKSDVALRIAEEFSGEVINCDSLQIYRYFDLGTAKLRPEERRGIPHHIIDILDPDQVFTAGEYARLASSVLAEVNARKRLPVIAGGTGFYVRALLDGLFPGPSRDQALRERLIVRERNRPGSIHRLLARFDPEASRRIHPNDIRKLVRALEVCLLTRRPAEASTRRYQR